MLWSWSWTLALSPPPYLSPQVTTLSSSSIAAKAVRVACICRTRAPFSWLWTSMLSPPQFSSPHTITEPSPRIPANAAAAAWMCFTSTSWSLTLLLSPPRDGSPQVTTEPSSRMAANGGPSLHRRTGHTTLAPRSGPLHRAVPPIQQAFAHACQMFQDLFVIRAANRPPQDSL